MRPIETLIARHPIAAYFALTFTISWGGVLPIIAGPAGMTGVKAQDHPLFPFAIVAMLAGPSLQLASSRSSAGRDLHPPAEEATQQPCHRPHRGA